MGQRNEDPPEYYASFKGGGQSLYIFSVFSVKKTLGLLRQEGIGIAQKEYAQRVFYVRGIGKNVQPIEK